MSRVWWYYLFFSTLVHLLCHSWHTWSPSPVQVELLVTHPMRRLSYSDEMNKKQVTKDWVYGWLVFFNCFENHTLLHFDYSCLSSNSQFKEKFCVETIKRKHKPLVTALFPKMISSAARPPIQTTRRAIISCLVTEFVSSSGSCVTIPRAFPLGTMVALYRGTAPSVNKAHSAWPELQSQHCIWCHFFKKEVVLLWTNKKIQQYRVRGKGWWGRNIH